MWGLGLPIGDKGIAIHRHHVITDASMKCLGPGLGATRWRPSASRGPQRGLWERCPCRAVQGDSESGAVLTCWSRLAPCPTTPTAPPRSAPVVVVHSSGAASGRMSGRRCATAPIAAATRLGGLPIGVKRSHSKKGRCEFRGGISCGAAPGFHRVSSVSRTHGARLQSPADGEAAQSSRPASDPA